MNVDSLELQCDQCSTHSTELFTCETCCQVDEQVESAKEQICDVCIGSHLRRNHSIVDGKGNEPSICTEHKMLELEFCQSCDATFCWKCMSKHSNHSFNKLEKRGTELRGKVFEMLTDLELAEKPLRAEKERLTKISENRLKELQALREQVDAKIEKLRKNLTIIDENCTQAKSEVVKVTENIEKTVDLQQKLRELLSSSNAHLLKKFAETKREVMELKFEHENVTRTDNSTLKNSGDELIAQNFVESTTGLNDNLNAIMSPEGPKTEKQWNPLLNVKATSDFIFSRDNEVFRIFGGNGKLITELIEVSESGAVTHSIKGVIDFNEKLNYDRLFCFNFRSSTAVLIITDKNSAYLLVLQEKGIQLKKTELPSFKNILFPYSQNYRGELEWCYWNENDKSIIFTHNSQFRIECNFLPSVRRSNASDSSRLVFITAENNIIVADAQKNVYWTIPIGDSSPKIICSTMIRDDLFLWLSDDQSVLIYSMEGTNFDFSVEQKCDPKSMVARIKHGYYIYSLLPGLRRSSGEYDRYLFVVCGMKNVFD